MKDVFDVPPCFCTKSLAAACLLQPPPPFPVSGWEFGSIGNGTGNTVLQEVLCQVEHLADMQVGSHLVEELETVQLTMPLQLV